MGTRGLTIVKLGGKVKVAQYGQWDHYPTGQGKTIAEFIRNKLDLKKFKKQVQKLKFVSDSAINSIVTENLLEEFPEFHRDTGARILELIQEDKVHKVANSLDFLKDGLFCEYAYELDLDKQKVKVYVGGQSYKTLTFEEFSKVGAMDKLEEKLNRG